MNRFTLFAALLALLLSLTPLAQDKPKPLPRDIPSLKELAEKGDAEAQFQLAEKYYYGEGIEKDRAQSFKWASRSAAQNNPKAQYRLAWIYRQGREIAKDEDKAKALFKKSAEGLKGWPIKTTLKLRLSLECYLVAALAWKTVAL